MSLPDGFGEQIAIANHLSLGSLDASRLRIGVIGIEQSENGSSILAGGHRFYLALADDLSVQLLFDIARHDPKNITAIVTIAIADEGGVQRIKANSTNLSV